MSSTSAVWMPQGSPSPIQSVLMVPSSKGQAMSLDLLEMELANKLSRLAVAAEEAGESPRVILSREPELESALQDAVTIREMAESVLMTDGLSMLMTRVSFSSRPTQAPEALQRLADQTLDSWLGDLREALPLL